MRLLLQLTLSAGQFTSVKGSVIHGETQDYSSFDTQTCTGIRVQRGTSTNGTMTVSSGSVITATACKATLSSQGIAVQGDINMEGGHITATAGDAGSAGAEVMSIGILADKNIIVSAGEVTANGGGVSGNGYPFSAGFRAMEITVSGGTVSASGGATPTGHNLTSCGILCFGTNGLTVSGGTLTAVGNASGGESYGVHSISDSGIIKVTGGKLTAKTTDSGPRKSALSKALMLGPGVGANGSTLSDGTSRVPYARADNATYMWVETTLFPALSVAATPSGSVVKDTVVTLTAMPYNIDNPTYQWYSNTRISTEDASVIQGATASTYVPPTGTAGRMNYFCIANGTIASNTVGVTVLVPTVTTVAVNPATVSVQKGGTQTFNATVSGENSPAQTVTWTVEGGVTGTSIDADGVLTIAANETATSLTVKATSTINTDKSGTATVTVTTPHTDPDPIEHKIIKGQNGKWTKGSSNGLGFTADGDYSTFTGVLVDGATISNDNYTSQSGSTIVTLKASYLQTLSDGQHTLRINFSDGYVETHFTINAATNPDIPATGDSSETWLWMGIALLTCAGLAASFVLARRKRQNG